MDTEKLLDELVSTFVKDDAPDWVKDLVRAELEKIINHEVQD